MPGFATRAIRAAGRTPDAPQPPVNVPIYQTSTFEVASAMTNRPRLIWAETIANPTTEMADLAALADLAHQREALLMVDNTFASPYLCNPLALGADLVVHSLTKYVGGHSDLIAGAVV